MNNQGTRGKYAEGVFRKWAKGMSDSLAEWAFLRYPDARAGSKSSVPSDFEVLYKGKHFNIEVKEVNHVCRLPQKNFSVDKIARMRKWEMAGSSAWVLIYFAPTKLWTIETVGFFLQQEGGSWNFEGHARYSFKDAVAEIFELEKA